MHSGRTIVKKIVLGANLMVIVTAGIPIMAQHIRHPAEGLPTTESTNTEWCEERITTQQPIMPGQLIFTETRFSGRKNAIIESSLKTYYLYKDYHNSAINTIRLIKIAVPYALTDTMIAKVLADPSGDPNSELLTIRLNETKEGVIKTECSAKKILLKIIDEKKSMTAIPLS